MGKNSNDNRGNKPAEQTPANPNPTTTVQPFMPGMDQMLAQQLAAGFGGVPQDFLTAFAQTYAPMQVPQNAVFTPPKDTKNSSGLSSHQQWLEEHKAAKKGH